MKKINWSFILLATMISCSSKPKSLAEEKTETSNALDKEKTYILESIHERDMTQNPALNLDVIASEDGKVVFAGGAFSVGGLLRSALFKSEDGGITWKEIEAYVYGSSVTDIDIVKNQINVFLTYGIEGAFFNGTLRSLDGGLQWNRLEGLRDEKNQEKIRAHIGCCFEQALKGHFKNENEGYVLISDYRYLLLKTLDGGQNYTVEKLLAKVQKNPPKLKELSKNPSPYEYRIRQSKKLNSDKVPLAFEIESRIAGKTSWKKISELPTFWTLDKVTLKATPMP
jgi:photosystem II stability/assembly factor-like uncharacterized protein